MRQHKALRRAVLGATATALAGTLLAVAGAAEAASERPLTMTGSATGGTTVTPWSMAGPGEVQLLTGFDLKYLNGDHHIKTIATLPRSDGRIDVAFEDRYFDDPMSYGFRISYAQLPGAIVPPTLSKTCGGGSCTFALQPPPSTDYVFILRGFRLSFIPTEPSNPFFPGTCSFYCDHHIGDVGVVPGNGTVTVTYADKNYDDDYTAEIAYAYVPRTLVASLTTVNGESDSGVGRRSMTIAGTKAIRGFRIRYAPIPGYTYPPDRHILRFGYLLSSTGVTAYFGDETPETTWKYQLMYATFK